MAKLSPSSKRGSAGNRLAPKKGSAPGPHRSPGRAAGARATPTSGVSPKPMRKPAGNSKGMGKGALKSGMSSPLTRNRC